MSGQLTSASGPAANTAVRAVNVDPGCRIHGPGPIVESKKFMAVTLVPEPDVATQAVAVDDVLDVTEDLRAAG